MNVFDANDKNGCFNWCWWWLRRNLVTLTCLLLNWVGLTCVFWLDVWTDQAQLNWNSIFPVLLYAFRDARQSRALLNKQIVCSFKRSSLFSSQTACMENAIDLSFKRGYRVREQNGLQLAITNKKVKSTHLNLKTEMSLHCWPTTLKLRRRGFGKVSTLHVSIEC